MKAYWRWLAIIIGLHLVLGLVYDWATPIFEASDEAAHYAVVHWLANGHPLPVQEPGRPQQPWAQEGSQPPLYYFLGAGLTAWVDTRDYEQVFVRNPLSRVGVPGTTHNVNLYRHSLAPAPLRGTALAVRLLRWFSLTLSAGTLYLTSLLARRAAPGRPRLGLLATGITAFNPMALFINASVNNDNLVMFLGTCALVLILDELRPEAGRWWRSLGLGLVLGLAALTKVSGLVLWPVAALALGLGAWRSRDWRRLVLGSALIAAAAVAVCGWWYLRNWNLYGEWLGLNTMVAVAGPRLAPITIGQLIRTEWVGFWLSYWGIFGVFTIRAADWVYWVYGGLTAWALVGAALALLRRSPRPRLEWLLLAVFCGLTLAGVVNWTLRTYASQGRLMFGALAPLSFFLALGAASATRYTLDHFAVRRAAVGWLLAAGTLVLVLVAALVPVLYIAPRYAAPPRLTETNLPSDLKPVKVVFGGQVELLGYTAGDEPYTPGQAQPVTLYWRALRPMDSDYALALHLLGRGAAEVGKIDTWPGGGNAPTSEWRPGDIFADHYLLPIEAAAAAPSLLRLDVAWFTGARNELLARDPSGQALSNVSFQLGRLIPAHGPAFTTQFAGGTTYENGIHFLGLDLSVGGQVTLYWQTNQPVPGAYTVFLHLVRNGMLLAQADAPPVSGDWPTSAWVPGQAFADLHQFVLPSPLPPGPYTLQLGLYTPEDGLRLAAFRPDGTEWPADAVVIEGVEIH
jgi:4-amino-4-deoxy-L-arabinose transferase-like glycosyltransferase